MRKIQWNIFGESKREKSAVIFLLTLLAQRNRILWHLLRVRPQYFISSLTFTFSLCFSMYLYRHSQKELHWFPQFITMVLFALQHIQIAEEFSILLYEINSLPAKFDLDFFSLVCVHQIVQWYPYHWRSILSQPIHAFSNVTIEWMVFKSLFFH